MAKTERPQIIEHLPGIASGLGFAAGMGFGYAGVPISVVTGTAGYAAGLAAQKEFDFIADYKRRKAKLMKGKSLVRAKR